ncbi:MAG: type IV pilus assembly protein PilM [Syntrophomonadaceae bacterium]|nr:type IV pilus assembly protein PilM [Syntrophomonadaceae bacterium]
MFSNRSSVGLDIGERRIKIVQVKKTRKGFRVSAYGCIETPPGAMENGVITDPVALGEQLGKLVRELLLQQKKSVAAVPGHQVYTRIMVMPQMKLQELRQAALFQASSFLPIDIEEVTSDIFPVREYEDEEGKKTEVFFIAVRKTETDNLFTCCQHAGLKLTRVEIGATALARVYSDYFQENQGKVIAVFNIGANRSCISVYSEGILSFLRFMPFGAAQFYPDENNGTGIHGDIDLKAERNHVLLHEIGSELMRSTGYYEIQNPGKSIDLTIICGGGSRIKGIEEELASRLNHPVELGRLNHNLILPNMDGQPLLADFRHDYPIALGLALRGVL